MDRPAGPVMEVVIEVVAGMDGGGSQGLACDVFVLAGGSVVLG